MAISGARELPSEGNLQPDRHWFMPPNANTMDRSNVAGRPRAGEPQAAADPHDPCLEDMRPGCFHCGTECPDRSLTKQNRYFCCQGCLTVFELLAENGLDSFYSIGPGAGMRGGGKLDPEPFLFVNQEVVRQQLVDFADGRLTRVTFRIPAIHCVACVWLLENLPRLCPGVIHSVVNFPRKEVAIAFETQVVELSAVVSALASIGYEPELRLSDLGMRARPSTAKRLWLQVGIAGFAFGNTMLFSLASYMGLDTGSGASLRRLMGVLSLILAVPVVTYCAADYWKSAWLSLRQRLLNIDVPIVAGILALFSQSSFEVLTGRGEGYFDSLAALLFFLLSGKLFQQKTFERLAFDRDYRSFFPLSARRIRDGRDEPVSISELSVGDEILIRHGELIPGDSVLVEGAALIDYSFVTGESQPVSKGKEDYLYAGGRQVGSAIQVRMVKAVSQGYLASLWNQEAFQKEQPPESVSTLTNRYSQRFTKLIFSVAIGAALYWAWVDPRLSIKAFASVLIVACPCALALAAPFALGSAQRLLARRHIFLKHAAVIETLAAANTVVFDKTGTLTTSRGRARFQGSVLSSGECQWLCSLAQQSTHPLARRLVESLQSDSPKLGVQRFEELPGNGISGRVSGHDLLLGSASFLQSRGISLWSDDSPALASVGSRIYAAVDGTALGWFDLPNGIRPDMDQLVSSLTPEYRLALLSGDNEGERPSFETLFGRDADLRFSQSPAQKLGFIEQRQAAGGTVVMVGDGLNDAGALKQADVGIAVVEQLNAFSPASDVIMDVALVPDLERIMRFARRTVLVVRTSFVISAVYNLVGMTIAARAGLSPAICAVLMPLSSVTVVGFACGLTTWFGRQALAPAASKPVPEWTATRWEAAAA